MLHVMADWQIPRRESLLPVSPEQSCAVCGRDDWMWLYLLLSAPEWVLAVGWFPNWFMVMCSQCREDWEAGNRAELTTSWRACHGDESEPGLDEFISVVSAMQSEPPRSRSEVTLNTDRP
jgi:hypothetical protein